MSLSPAWVLLIEPAASRSTRLCASRRWQLAQPVVVADDEQRLDAVPVWHGPGSRGETLL
jgi:hypothetical protein